MMAVKIVISANLPERHFAKFLQTVRTFDAEHDECHFEIAASAPDLSIAEIESTLDKIEPPLPWRQIFRKQ